MTPLSWKKRLLLSSSVAAGLMSLSGCIATRGWVQEQLAPVNGQIAKVEARVDKTDARTAHVSQRMAETEAHLGQTTTKAELALKNLEHLRRDQNFVLGIKEGINFAPGSTTLSRDARHAIDGFLQTLEGIDDTVFLVAGYADSVGNLDQNYALAQKRAASVARYLITRKNLDPLRVAVTAYGELAPLSANTTPRGRLKNRRVEIQVYKETVTSAPGAQRLELQRSSRP